MALYKIVLHSEEVIYVTADSFDRCILEYTDECIASMECLSLTVMNIMPEETDAITPKSIINSFCNVNNLKYAELIGPTKVAQYADARKALSYILRNRLKLSYNGIGGILERSHTSVMHMVKNMDWHLVNRKGLPYTYLRNFNETYFNEEEEI